MATSRSAAALPAYVLHQYDWSESSLVVELFTRAQGRVVVVAKGAKRPTSNFRPVLLPFQPLLVSLGKPPRDEAGEIVGLRAAEWAGGAAPAAPGMLFAGFYLNELLLKLLPRQDAHPALFDAYAAALAALAAGADEAPVLRAFELVLLRELGWLPAIDAVTPTGRPVETTLAYTLHGEHGLVVATSGIDGATLSAVHAALEADDLVGLRDACLAPATAHRDALAAVLHYHLGNASLRTRQVMHGVHQLQRARAQPRG